MCILFKNVAASNLARLCRTLVHLRPQQFCFRARKIVLFKLIRLIALRQKFTPISIQPKPIINLLKPESRNSYLGHRTFCFLNTEKQTNSSWQAQDQSPLWQFNLHYFDFLFSERGQAEGFELIADWIKQIPAGDKLAWHPYPSSRRICNWIKFLSEKSSAAELQTKQEILQSLRSQIAVLKLFLEKDLLGNHLLANAKALVLGGLFINDNQATRLGLGILEEQLPEQILSDGGHYERSPMYHCIVLEDLADCFLALKLTRQEIPEFLKQAIRKMSAFLATITEDNSIPLLNDSAEGVAIRPNHLLDFALQNNLIQLTDTAAEATSKLTCLEQSGLILLRSQKISLTFDVGKLGPDFLLGHAHNDSLSILLSLNGQQILTDSGVYHYQGDLRTYFRSARAHNVVMLEDIEPNEIWSSFRVGRRGYPAEVSFDPVTGTASASHTGYQRFNLKISRIIKVLEDGLIWTDRITSLQQEHQFESNLHFAPGLSLSAPTKSGNLNIQSVIKDDQKIASFVSTALSDFKTLSSPYSEYFGQKTDRLNLRCVNKVKGQLELRYGIFAGQVPDNFSALFD